MSAKTENFINIVGPIARNEFLSRDKWILPSICIAQAAVESGWNLKAKSVFGIKGKGFVATTSEFYNGNYVVIKDSFRTYPDLASSVVGYYDFLAKTPRYAKAINNSDYVDAVDKLIHTTDGFPYATDPNYINKICTIIRQYKLTKWDCVDVVRKTASQLAVEVIQGKWGNGGERRTRLESAGYSYEKVQAIVNQLAK